MRKATEEVLGEVLFPVPIRFTVLGKPVAQGSKRGFARGKHVAIVENNPGPHAMWRNRVSLAADHARGPDFVLLEGPIQLAVRFYFQRPKGQSKAGQAETFCPKHLDLDKLLRAIGDSLSGILYVDDRQIVSFDGTCKLWAEVGESPRAEIEVTSL